LLRPFEPARLAGLGQDSSFEILRGAAYERAGLFIEQIGKAQA
jgi:hypothetical protein